MEVLLFPPDGPLEPTQSEAAGKHLARDAI